MKQVVFGRTLAVRFAVAMTIALLSMVQLVGTSSPVVAQGTALIEILNTDADTGQPVPFTRFQVTSENGTVYGPLETDLNGYVAFSVVVDPWGTSFTIEEETPPACADSPTPQTTDPLLADESALVNFTTQDHPGCGLATIALYAMSCPEGFSGPADDYAPWRDGCLGHGDGTQFTITSVATGQEWYPVAAGYGIPGRAPVVGLPVGDYAFQQAGESPAAVFCLVYDTENYVTSPDPSSVVALTLRDGVGTIDLDGDRVSCDVFTVPGGIPSAEPIVEQPILEEVEPVSTGSFVEAHALLCPAGTPPDSNLYDACHANGMGGVVFSVSGPNGFFAEATTTVPITPGPGVAVFDDLTGGIYTVTLEGIEPDTTVVMYCSLADADDAVPFTHSGSGSISLELPTDTGVVCDFSVIPPIAPDPTTTLQIIDYACPLGTVIDTSTPLSTLEALCTDTIDGIDFTLSPFGLQGVTLESGMAGPGTVLFQEVFSGSYALSNSIPGDFNTPWAFCGIEGTELQPLTWLQGGDPLEIDAAAGPYLCKWFDNPDDARGGFADTLTITSYLCPPGISSAAIDRCTTAPLAGTTFDLVRNKTSERYQEITDGQGMLAFDRLDVGGYTLTAIPPAGTNVAVYVAACEANGQSFDFAYDDATGMRIRLDLPGGVDVVCAWYNIPPAVPTVVPGGNSGSITVHKFLCEGKSVSTYNWERDCVAQTNPAGFSLKTIDDRPIAVGSTDNSGILKFTNLANGAYRLDETTGNWCHAEADRVDSAGNLLVSNGGNNDVFIYNCSIGQVGVLPSTGTGSVTTTDDPGFESDRLWQLGIAAGGTLGLALVARRRLQQVASHVIQEEDVSNWGDGPDIGR